VDTDDNSGRERIRIDYTLAFTYIFKDPHWIKKTLIGGILIAFSFLIIPGLFVAGYYIRTIRRAGAGEAYGLPPWDNWEELAATGLKFSIAVILYSLPIVLISLVFLAVTFVPAALTQNQDGLLAFSAFALVLVSEAAFFVLVVAFTLWLPSVEIRFASKGTIGSCFQFKELYGFLRSNIADYFVIYLILFGMNYLAGLGMIFFFVGILFTAFYTWMVGAHLKGQLLANSLKEI
jgi:hypothetical protein